MRVITGIARGRKLKEPEGMEIRPTTDQVKEALFNIIQFDIEGRKVLDLFAGSGQLGIEALSRGAASCVFVDSARDSVRLVQENLRREGLEPNLVLLGYCPHKQAVQEQRGASLLLLPLRDAPEMRAILPGKVFEYLAARRPVLGFGQTDGAQAALLEETGAGVTAGWADETLMRDFLEKQWQQHLSGGVPATTCAIDRYSRASLTHELALLLNIIVLSEDSSLRSE